jgi:DNA polymerase III delta prime subunit
MNKNIYKLDIDRIKREVCEIIELHAQPDSNLDCIKEKYCEFIETYPLIYKNIVNKTMTADEINILLDTFNTAQTHFINNIRK